MPKTRSSKKYKQKYILYQDWLDEIDRVLIRERMVGLKIVAIDLQSYFQAETSPQLVVKDLLQRARRERIFIAPQQDKVIEMLNQLVVRSTNGIIEKLLVSSFCFGFDAWLREMESMTVLPDEVTPILSGQDFGIEQYSRFAMLGVNRHHEGRQGLEIVNLMLCPWLSLPISKSYPQGLIKTVKLLNTTACFTGEVSDDAKKLSIDNLRFRVASTSTIDLIRSRSRAFGRDYFQHFQRWKDCNLDVCYFASRLALQAGGVE